MLTDLSKFPAPFFGGKKRAAAHVWAALGDVHHFVEAFCGSCAVLLERPHPCNRPYHSETVNDVDGLLVNVLRSIQLQPQATAEAASFFVTECDLMARHLALLRFVQEHDLERLMADPLWCDPQVAGMWLYGLSAWIGSGWCGGDGPWVVDESSGRIVRRQDREPGVHRKRPHLSDNGKGMHRQTLREPGVHRKLPHLHDNGQGVQRQTLREPGVWRQRPHLGNDGQGVQRQTLREPGVMGSPTTPDPQADWVAAVAADYAATDGFHPLTMPELRRWFAWLSARLRHVRIVNGDWRRVCTSGVLKTLSVRDTGGVVGVFLDPPYTSTERDPGLYRHESQPGDELAAVVRDWCLESGDDPQYRIVLAGFAGEGHEELEAHGWRVVEWFTHGHLTGGMGNTNSTNGGAHQQHRERLWLSPHTLRPEATAARQGELFAWGEEG
jgi:hypothetical protein